MVTGTKAGSEGTRIEGTPSVNANNMIILTGSRIRFEGIVFRSSPLGGAPAHTGAIISGTATSGLEIIDCEFQAEGANNTGAAILLGAAGSIARDRNRIKDCWVRSSPDGTPATFRGVAVSLNGTGLIENCIVEGFTANGVFSLSVDDPLNIGTRISKCVVDMSSCTSTSAIGISASGVMVSNCRVRCPGLITNLDSARAIVLENAGAVAGGESGLVENCQLSGKGTASTRRIGIGISIPAAASLCKISGCGIKDFRKQGVKIEGDLNLVVHNIIHSIDDGAAGGAAIEIISGGDNNLVDANIETGTGGTPYVDGGTGNFFDIVATADNTGNKSV